MPELLTLQETADYLGVSIHTIYKWVQARKIPFLRVGRHIRVDPDELSTWLQSRRVPAGGGA